MMTRDQRQYSLMLRVIDQYRNNEIDTGYFIPSVHGLLEELDEEDPDWKARFLKLWDVVEVAWAYQIDANMSEMRRDHLDVVCRAVDDLKRLVLEKRAS